MVSEDILRGHTYTYLDVLILVLVEDGLGALDEVFTRILKES